MTAWHLSISPAAARVMPWLGRLASIAMAALLAWLLADIYWALAAVESPRPASSVETDPQRALQAISARHLFGVAPAGAAVSSAPTDIRLNGAIAAQHPGQPAYAVLVVEGKRAQMVREGEEVVPGITLQRVLPRQVELLRGGQTQILTLPQRGKP